MLVAACAEGREPPPDISVLPVLDRALSCGDGGVDAPRDASVDGGADSDADPGVAPPAVNGRVVLVSVDGLRPDAIFAAPAAALQALGCRGAYSFRARTILPSLTLPSHASMLSGVLADRHGIIHNDVAPGYIGVPTVLGLARQAGKRVVVVVGKEKLGQLAPPESRDVFRWVPGRAGAIVDAALAEAALGFDLMFVHLPDADDVGHYDGWMSAAYLRAVRAVDAALERLFATLPADTTVIVTADHGGARYIHGYDLPEHVFIPWLMAGPGVPVAHQLASDVATVDTAATVARLLGVSLPADAVGRAVEEALRGPPRPSP